MFERNGVQLWIDALVTGADKEMRRGQLLANWMMVVESCWHTTSTHWEYCMILIH